MVRASSSVQCHHIYLFGASHIEHEKEPVRLPTRKTESLFAYLILYPQAHSREKLVTLFWGDSSHQKAHGSLRRALASLRKSIGDEIVIAGRESVQLNPDFPLWVDVLEFERQARAFIPNSLAEPNRIDLRLYQGDLLCDHYDDWILPLREYHRSLYLEVLLRMVERLRAQSEYKSAIDVAQKILAADPANERAYQHLIFCHVTLGDGNKALQQYKACRRALQDELAVEPARETQALYHWIKQSPSDIASLTAKLTNLPIPISSFVGRARELSTIKQLVSKTRLVTLTGAGGSGKTRLVIHAATDLIDSFRDGVWWVELASLTDASLVPSAVAKALGVRPQTDQSLIETLAHFMRAKKILLILDNCEHLVDASAKLTEHLLNACPDLKILCTSREALGLTGESVWYVPILSLPDVKVISLVELLMQYEGIHLFVERAKAVKTDFTLDERNILDVAQICQRLDGIPLAIELAAARVKTLSVDRIAARLNDRFHLLTAEIRTTPARHQSLRAAIDWSYDLLSDDERRLFCRLSVFSGGWTLDAAETVCSGEGIERGVILNLLARLVDKSLVIMANGGRYGMLETIRQYGNEKLTEADMQDWISEKHLDYYLKMAAAGDEKIRSSEQMEWLKWFEAGQDNFAGAMEMALSSPITLEKGYELVCSVCWYWKTVGNYIAMRHWLGIFLSRSVDLAKSAARARLLFNAGLFSVAGLNWLELPQAQAAIEESLEIWNELGPDFTFESAKSLLMLGWIQKRFLDNDNGYEYMNQALTIFEETDHVWWQAWALNFLGAEMVNDSRDIEITRRLLEKEKLIWEKSGDQCTSWLFHGIWLLSQVSVEIFMKHRNIWKRASIDAGSLGQKVISSKRWPILAL